MNMTEQHSTGQYLVVCLSVCLRFALLAIFLGSRFCTLKLTRSLSATHTLSKYNCVDTWSELVDHNQFTNEANQMLLDQVTVTHNIQLGGVNQM